MFPEPRTLAMRAFPLADRGPTGRIVVTMTDITQRRRLEVLRRDFVANASHELKTPVAAVRALAETLLTALPEDPEAGRRFAERIGREAERLDLLARDLLDLSRVERGTLDVEPRRPGRAGQGGRRRLHGPGRGAAGQARQRAPAAGVACAATGPSSGCCCPTCSTTPCATPSAKGTVESGWRPPSAAPRIQVIDTGEGIPATELPRVFERFYRVDKARARQTGGTGLGLAIVRHVAEAHGGTVRVDSELGRGSTFTVTLPVAGPPGPRRSEGQPSQSADSRTRMAREMAARAAARTRGAAWAGMGSPARMARSVARKRR